MKFFVLISFLAATSTIAFSKTRVACVGDSITFGAGVAAREKMSYPAFLGNLLGAEYEVRNFGVSARTMLTKGDHPYTKEKAFETSLAFEPNIVIIKLGTNDSKPQNWKFKADFAADTLTLINHYKELPSKPRIILCKPVPVVKQRWGITEEITRGEVAKQIEQVAFDSGTEIVDLHATLIDKPEFLPDHIHPNSFGAEVIARHLFRYLKTERKGPEIKLPDTKASNFYGFPCYDFEHEGIKMKLAVPKLSTKGQPWIWRARFWGHQPQFDKAMLELGWHIVYADVANLFGSPEAIARWEKAYAYTQSLGLGAKPVLLGMSRGGLPIHNWALKHPDKTGGIIGDNCVMDFTSWPGGLGKGKGSAKDWLRCKEAYGFKSDQEAIDHPKKPIDTVKELAAKNIPIMYLIGDADKIVPPQENSAKAVKKLENYAGLQVILKPSLGHHPHSLPNPASIVNFALRCQGSYTSPANQAAPSAEFRGQLAGWVKGTWWDQHDKINQIAQNNKDLELIFLGDSISQSWTGHEKRVSEPKGSRTFDKVFGSRWKSASFGLSGERTEHLLFRIQNGNFEGLKPKAIVLTIGVNNALAGHQAEDIVAGIKAVVALIHAKMPDTKIILLGPIPAKPEVGEVQQELAQVHPQIAKLNGTQNVHYINPNTWFQTADGELKKDLYAKDGIHLTAMGYEAWAEGLLPQLEKILKKP